MRNLRAVKNKSYYIAVRQMISKLGYEDPATDTDARQREVWEALEQHNCHLEIITGYDCKNLGKHSSKYFKFFQTRANNEQGIADYYEEFYILKKRQERIIFGMKLSNGEVFIFVGNKRIRAHEKAIKEGEASLCDVVMVNVPGTTDDEKCALAHKLARKGNKQEHTVRSEHGYIDYPFQLEAAYELECICDPVAKDWSTAERIEWGKRWMISEISSDFKHPSKKTYLGTIVNSAFAEHRGSSLPVPNSQEIEKNLQTFWPKMRWSGEPTAVEKISCSSRIDKIIEKLRNPWMKRELFTDNRTHAHLVLRAGNQIDAEITSTETVAKYRSTAIKQLTAYNTNVNVVGAGMVLPTRIMFVKQMDRDDYEAWEWNFDDECYDEVPGK